MLDKNDLKWYPRNIRKVVANVARVEKYTDVEWVLYDSDVDGEMLDSSVDILKESKRKITVKASMCNTEKG